MQSPVQRTAEECAQAQLDAYNARNIDQFAAVYHPDIQLIDLATNNVFCNGIEALKARYGPMFAERTELRCNLVKRIVCPPFVSDEELVQGLVDGETVHAVATYECRDGLIVRAWFYRGATA